MRKESQHNPVKWKYAPSRTHDPLENFRPLLGVGEVIENGEAANPGREVDLRRINSTLFHNSLMALPDRWHGDS